MINRQSVGLSMPYAILQIGWATFDSHYSVTSPEVKSESGGVVIPLEQSLLHGLQVDPEVLRSFTEKKQHETLHLYTVNESRPNATLAQILSEFASVLDNLYLTQGVRNVWGTHIFHLEHIAALFDYSKVARPIILRDDERDHWKDFHSFKLILRNLAWRSTAHTSRIWDLEAKYTIAELQATTHATEASLLCQELVRLEKDSVELFYIKQQKEKQEREERTQENEGNKNVRRRAAKKR